MSNSDFGGHIKYGGISHHNGHIFWIVHRVWRGVKRRLGRSRPDTLSYYIALALEIPITIKQSQSYSSEADKQPGRQQKLASRSNVISVGMVDAEDDIKDLHSSHRFLNSLMFVALAWVVFTAWLASVHAIHDANSSAPETVSTAPRTAPYSNSIDSLIAHDDKSAASYPAAERAYSLSMGRQMFNPAFGQARSEAAHRPLVDQSIVCSTATTAPEFDSRVKVLLDESMLGELSVPSQINDGWTAGDRAPFNRETFPQASPGVNVGVPVQQRMGISMSLTEQPGLNIQPLDKPRPKMTITSR